MSLRQWSGRDWHCHTPAMSTRAGQRSWLLAAGCLPRDPSTFELPNILLVPRAASAGELCCGLCWPCWFYLPLGNCPGETVVVPTPTMVARAGQRRATSLWLAALPLTTKLAYELPNTLLVRRTSSTRELRLQALLPMTTSLAYARPHTHTFGPSHFQCS